MKQSKAQVARKQLDILNLEIASTYTDLNDYYVVSDLLVRHLVWLNECIEVFQEARRSFDLKTVSFERDKVATEIKSKNYQHENPLTRIARLDNLLDVIFLERSGSTSAIEMPLTVEYDNRHYYVLRRKFRTLGRMYDDNADPAFFLKFHTVIAKNPVADLEVKVENVPAFSKFSSDIKRLFVSLDRSDGVTLPEQARAIFKDAKYKVTNKGKIEFPRSENIEANDGLNTMLSNAGIGIKVLNANFDGIEYPLVVGDDNMTFRFNEPQDSIAQIQDKIIATLNYANSEGYHIVVFPELSVPNACRKRIEEWLSKHHGQHKIILVVAGSYHFQNGSGSGWKNESMIYDGNGMPLLRQEKLTKLIRGRYEEEIEHQNEIKILNTELGLIGVAICKDFLDEWRVMSTLWLNMDLDILFVVSMGGTATISGHQRKAGIYNRAFGSTIIVTNQCIGGPSADGRKIRFGIEEREKKELDDRQLLQLASGFLYHRGGLEHYKPRRRKPHAFLSSRFTLNRLIPVEV